VSDAGDLLELLHGAAGRWQSVQTALRGWRDLEVAEQAHSRWREEQRHLGRSVSVMFASDGDAERPREHEHTARLWIAKPDRWREESEDQVVAGRGGHWWSSSPYNGFVSNEDDPEVGHGDPVRNHAAHLDPAGLIPLLSFEEIAHAGEVIRVRARPRAGEHFGPGLPPGADSHLLLVDARRGVVLRCESSLEGTPFGVSELVEPAWDVEIPDERFVLEPPPGEVVRSPRELHPEVTLAEAAERAPFAVFAVTELPEGEWRLRVHYNEPFRDRPGQLHVLYHRADGRGTLMLAERSAGELGGPSRIDGQARLEVEREGTTITLSSETLDEAQLEELAGRLERV
jgi:hypothetical protein